jgi:hypothetical protein
VEEDIGITYPAFALITMVSWEWRLISWSAACCDLNTLEGGSLLQTFRELISDLSIGEGYRWKERGTEATSMYLAREGSGEIVNHLKYGKQRCRRDVLHRKAM